ncbi:MAG: hypothetical protein KBD78_16335 [Oligoflexales bacterium]|nr:hypothetical protein [Oligoflexales bacterium]
MLKAKGLFVGTVGTVGTVVKAGFFSAWALCLLSQSVYAFEISGSSEESCGQLKSRPALEFKPFSTLNPKTKKPYKSGDTLDFPTPDGKSYRVNALSHIAKLNETEKKLNAQGYSIRDAGIETGDFIDCMENYSSTFDNELLDQLSGNIDSYKDTPPNVEYPELPPLSDPDIVIQKKQHSAVVTKSWAFEVGQKNKLYTGIFPYLNIEASKIEASLDAGARWRVALFKKVDWELAHVNAYGTSPGSGALSAGVDVYVLNGMKVYSKPIVRAKSLEFRDSYSQAISRHTDIPFMVGPIPAKVRLGVRGEVGLKWNVMLNPLQAGAATVPWAGADVFAQVGGDAVIAGGGVVGQIVLLKDSLVVNGTAAFQYNEKPEVSLDALITNKLNALSGELSFFFYMYKPKDVDPYYEKFEIKRPLYKHAGYNFEQELYRLNHKVTF